MRALVTGGTGFIGSHMVELLLELGWEVVCPVRKTNAVRHLAGIGIRAVPMDALAGLIRSGPPFNYVIHLAGNVAGSDYESLHRDNVHLTASLLNLLLNSPHRESLRKFVLVSSQAAGGPSPADGAPLRECDPPRPVSLYGKSKLEAERVVMNYAGSIPVTIVRPATVFGPRDPNVLFLFRAARYGLALCVAGPDRLMSLVFVSDLVRGIAAAALSPESAGETYFMANAEPVVSRQFCVNLAGVMGRRAVPVPLPVAAWKAVAFVGELTGKLKGSPSVLCYDKLTDMVQSAWVCSVEKARDQLEWEAETPVEEAIARTAQWYQEHGLL